MPVSTIAMSPSTFVNPDNTPIANGYLTVSMYSTSQDGTGVQLQDNKVKVLLNSSGQIISNLFPTDTVYLVSAYTAKGQLVAGPLIVTVTH